MDRLRLADLANPAGALTLARLPLAAAFVLVADRPMAALTIYLLGITTDLLDGALARRTGTTSDAGALADGISDKVFHLAVAAALWSHGLVPTWWLPLWFGREIGQLVSLPLFWSQARHDDLGDIRANRLGKNTTVALGAACILAMLQLDSLALVATFATGALGFAAAASYLWQLVESDTEEAKPSAVR